MSLLAWYRIFQMYEIEYGEKIGKDSNFAIFDVTKAGLWTRNGDFMIAFPPKRWFPIKLLGLTTNKPYSVGKPNSFVASTPIKAHIKFTTRTFTLPLNRNRVKFWLWPIEFTAEPTKTGWIFRTIKSETFGNTMSVSGECHHHIPFQPTIVPYFSEQQDCSVQKVSRSLLLIPRFIVNFNNSWCHTMEPQIETARRKLFNHFIS